ncbi:hypothetical protein QL285_019417 [Trifolium repens]|nr:hypothetical protein QL285_019417 [Trifolium repens]
MLIFDGILFFHNKFKAVTTLSSKLSIVFRFSKSEYAELTVKQPAVEATHLHLSTLSRQGETCSNKFCRSAAASMSVAERVLDQTNFQDHEDLNNNTLYLNSFNS